MFADLTPIVVTEQDFLTDDVLQRLREIADSGCVLCATEISQAEESE